MDVCVWRGKGVRGRGGGGFVAMKTATRTD